MKYKILLLLTSFLFSLPVFSQSLFKLNYHFTVKKGREDYKALLLRNEDGTGTIRIEFFDLETKARNLVEMETVESYGADDAGKEDTTILIYVGLEQKQVLGKVMYKPENFVFELNKQTHYYEPSFVLSINDDGTEDMGVLDNVRLLQQEDLTQEFMLQYFTQNDEVFENLFVNQTRDLSVSEKQTQLFLVLVANTEDRTIGKTCVIDKDATYKTFSEVAEYLGIQFKPTVIAGKDFTKANVDNAINTLRPGKKDIVVFYYSGHGFNEPGGRNNYPFLDLRDKTFQAFGDPYTLNVENIYANIKAKGARLNLVFSDCCNNLPTQTTNVNPEGASTRSSSIGWNMDNCRALFMNDAPLSLLMTAAAKGELSAGNSNNGGIFTFNFRETLEKSMGPFSNEVTWNSLLASTQKQTTARAKRSLCAQADESLQRCTQNPVYKMEAK